MCSYTKTTKKGLLPLHPLSFTHTSTAPAHTHMHAPHTFQLKWVGVGTSPQACLSVVMFHAVTQIPSQTYKNRNTDTHTLIQTSLPSHRNRPTHAHTDSSLHTHKNTWTHKHWHTHLWAGQSGGGSFLIEIAHPHPPTHLALKDTHKEVDCLYL